MDFDVDVTEIMAAAARMKAAEPMVRDEMTRAMKRSVLGVEGKAKALAPVSKPGGGHLRRSITSEVRAGGGTITGVVGTNVPYAKYVHDGRGPVVAINAKALRFKIGGKVLFRKSVKAAAAQPFMDQAINASMGAIAKEFNAIIPRLAKRLGF